MYRSWDSPLITVLKIVCMAQCVCVQEIGQSCDNSNEDSLYTDVILGTLAQCVCTGDGTVL